MAKAIDETSREASSVNQVSEMVVRTVEEMARFVEQFLSDVANDVDDRRRSLRVKTNELVEVQLTDGNRVAATMLDAADGGARLTGSHGVEKGDPVTIKFPDGRLVDAAVRWRSDQEMGVRFEEPQPDLKWLKAA